MRARLAVAALLGLLAVLPARTFAQQPTDAPGLITAAELRTQLEDPTLVVLHVGAAEDYAKGHIPGARRVEPRTLSAQGSELTMELPDVGTLKTALEGLGISDTSRVVVYAGASNLPAATRVVFTLDYAGLGGRTRLLDGGLAAWTTAGGPLTSDAPPPVKTGVLTLTPRPAVVASLDWVKEHHTSSDTLLVDARLTPFYTGESDNNGRIPRPGHVPGAKSLPLDTFLRADGTFKSRAELEAMLVTAGASRDRTIATYCHVGQQASVPYFVARMLGYDARLFDGSYEAWSRSEDLPVAKGTQP